MANDREVLRELWEGKLPICFQLNPDDLLDLQNPDPYYLMIPRLSYFPLVTDKVKKHFVRFISVENCENEMWLSYNGMPLKWHYPIGLLFDLHCGGEPQLPWNLQVNFTKFPENILLRCPNKETVEAHFMSTIKEADVLKHRGQIISGMQKKDHNQLWIGLQNDKFDQFWSINRRLMELSSENNYFKHIPIRFYEDDTRFFQKLISPRNDDASRKTLQQLLTEIYPQRKEAKIRTNGVLVPMETPIQWMSEHLSYPDNFLHLCFC